MSNSSAGAKSAAPSSPARRTTITVQLVRSRVGATRYQREVLRGLGLSRLWSSVERPDTPMIRGMVRRIPHLVRIVETGDGRK